MRCSPTGAYCSNVSASKRKRLISMTSMKASDNDTSITEAGRRNGYIPAVRPDATIEELDEWVRALGGRELTPEESKKLKAEIRWHDIPGESPEGSERK